MVAILHSGHINTVSELCTACHCPEAISREAAKALLA